MLRREPDYRSVDSAIALTRLATLQLTSDVLGPARDGSWPVAGHGPIPEDGWSGLLVVFTDRGATIGYQGETASRSS